MIFILNFEKLLKLHKSVFFNNLDKISHEFHYTWEFSLTCKVVWNSHQKNIFATHFHSSWSISCEKNTGEMNFTRVKILTGCSNKRTSFSARNVLPMIRIWKIISGKKPDSGSGKSDTRSKNLFVLKHIWVKVNIIWKFQLNWSNNTLITGFLDLELFGRPVTKTEVTKKHLAKSV